MILQEGHIWHSLKNTGVVQMWGSRQGGRSQSLGLLVLVPVLVPALVLVLMV